MDVAFLRRIQTKILIGAATEEQFCEVFRRVAADRGLECDPCIPKELISFIKNVLKEELRACYPRDIVNQICWAAKYEAKEPVLDQAAVMRAVDAYFLPKAQ
jgi:hypothetical protein